MGTLPVSAVAERNDLSRLQLGQPCSVHDTGRAVTRDDKTRPPRQIILNERCRDSASGGFPRCVLPMLRHRDKFPSGLLVLVRD
jgi:hypothetical protein